MKSMLLLPLALMSVLLTGCASGGYYSDYPGYAYPVGYYNGPYYGYGPTVGFGYYDGGYYRHDYHHYDNDYRHGYAGHGSYHGTHVASAGATHLAGHSGGGRSASVSSGSFHTGGGGHSGGGHGHR